MDKNIYIKRLWSKHKASAKYRGINNELDRNDYYHIVQSNCAYCGNSPSNKLKYKGVIFLWNGLDRIDSSQGYSLSNVLPCCNFCNSLKGSMKSKTWFDFLNSVIKTHGGNSPFSHFEDRKRANKSFFNR